MKAIGANGITTDRPDILENKEPCWFLLSNKKQPQEIISAAVFCYFIGYCNRRIYCRSTHVARRFLSRMTVQILAGRFLKNSMMFSSICQSLLLICITTKLILLSL